MSPLPVVYGTRGKVDILIDPSIYPTRFAELTQHGGFVSPKVTESLDEASSPLSPPAIASVQASANATSAAPYA